MNMNKFEDILKGGDLRSIGNVNEVIRMVITQDDFDELFENLKHSDRKVVMRTADAIEKITIRNTIYLQKHKKALLNLCQAAEDIELKWHLALLIPRIGLTKKELENIWDRLTKWATDREESKIVRVNSIQGLFNLIKNRPELLQDFNLILTEIEKENIPSINARIRKITNASR